MPSGLSKEGLLTIFKSLLILTRSMVVVKRALGVNGGKIVYASRSIKNVLLTAERVAQSDATVLSARRERCGKELIAAVHT